MKEAYALGFAIIIKEYPPTQLSKSVCTPQSSSDSCPTLTASLFKEQNDKCGQKSCLISEEYMDLFSLRTEIILFF